MITGIWDVVTSEQQKIPTFLFGANPHRVDAENPALGEDAPHFISISKALARAFFVSSFFKFKVMKW